MKNASKAEKRRSRAMQKDKKLAFQQAQKAYVDVVNKREKQLQQIDQMEERVREHIENIVNSIDSLKDAKAALRIVLYSIGAAGVKGLVRPKSEVDAEYEAVRNRYVEAKLALAAGLHKP